METPSGLETERKPMVINIEPVGDTPREKEVRAVAEEARLIALERLANASNLTDYMRWYRAVSIYLTPSNIDWIWDYGGTTPEGLIAEQESDRFAADNAKNATAAEALKTMIDALQPQEGMIRVGLKRVREQHIGGYTYRALVAFPEGTYVSDPLDGTIKTNQSKTGEDVIFFEPKSACVSHACDDLYKTHRNSAFYMPVRTLGDAINRLQVNRQGANEYLLEKTESGSVKQDAENYILVGLLGGYSNERFKIRISEFWNRPQQKLSPTTVK